MFRPRDQHQRDPVGLAVQTTQESRPLYDPLRAISKAALAALLGLLAFGLAQAVRLVWGFYEVQGRPPWNEIAQRETWTNLSFLLFLAVLVFSIYLATVVFFISFYLTIRPAAVDQAIYLRAFRLDAKGRRFRRVLQLALGPTFRLMGIRAPSRRIPAFLRAPLFTYVAFRYGASRFMDLEAGGDWLERLAVTAGGTRAVIIDLRGATDRVRMEIQVLARGVGLCRILFVVDPGESREATVAKLRDLLPADAELDAISVLPISSDEAEVCARLREFRNHLPAFPSGDTLPAVALARTLSGPQPPESWLARLGEYSPMLLLAVPFLVWLAYLFIEYPPHFTGASAPPPLNPTERNLLKLGMPLPGPGHRDPKEPMPFVPALYLAFTGFFLVMAWASQIWDTVKDLAVAWRLGLQDAVSNRFWRLLVAFSPAVAPVVIPLLVYGTIAVLRR